jgi:hypothetical protein
MSTTSDNERHVPRAEYAYEHGPEWVAFEGELAAWRRGGMVGDPPAMPDPLTAGRSTQGGVVTPCMVRARGVDVRGAVLADPLMTPLSQLGVVHWRHLGATVTTGDSGFGVAADADILAGRMVDALWRALGLPMGVTGHAQLRGAEAERLMLAIAPLVEDAAALIMPALMVADMAAVERGE